MTTLDHEKNAIKTSSRSPSILYNRLQKPYYESIVALSGFKSFNLLDLCFEQLAASCRFLGGSTGASEALFSLRLPKAGSEAFCRCRISGAFEVFASERWRKHGKTRSKPLKNRRKRPQHKPKISHLKGIESFQRGLGRPLHRSSSGFRRLPFRLQKTRRETRNGALADFAASFAMRLTAWIPYNPFAFLCFTLHVS